MIGLALVFQSGRHRQLSGRSAAPGGNPVSSWVATFTVLVPDKLATARVLVPGRRILSLGGTVFVLLGGTIFRFRKATCDSYSEKHTTKWCYTWNSGRVFLLSISGTTFFFLVTNPFCIRHIPCSVSFSCPAFILVFRKLPIPGLVVHWP